MSSLTLNISDPGDSKADKEITDTLQSLVNGSIDPAAAAHVIDKTVVTDCQEGLASYTSVPNPTSSQLEDGTIRAPYPAGWLKFLWDCVGKAAMEVPSDHPGQDRLVTLLQELQRLPRHSVPELVAGELSERELWTSTPANRFEGLELWLWELDQGTFTAAQQVESSHSVAASYVNFSAFLARLLAGGVEEATRMSALIQPSPFGTSSPLISPKYPDAAEAARHYEPYASAAAQWVFHAGDALFEMCEKGVIIDIGKQRWTRALWNGWKAKFDTIAKADRFSSQCRSLATQAVERMTQIEKSGTSSNIVDRFGFMSTEED
ncbi:hypothetical protein TOPH_03376 [Tolypocladium ophioglossoides CBS 100239]|uniref:Uncharacterized protein n=1 Tax=Tolypocladium ophioglossoides (strain CBS 100239) TaxID=1163406 RepID=A0A0L0NCW2_TOLOC|nr:hypothetical protein TOPH_03376 [Tolypocladium ophioglossoides CBS 100239]